MFDGRGCPSVGRRLRHRKRLPGSGGRAACRRRSRAVARENRNRLADFAIFIGIEPAINVLREGVELVEGSDQLERSPVVRCEADEIVLALSSDGGLSKTAGDDGSPCMRTILSPPSALARRPKHLRAGEVTVSWRTAGGRDRGRSARQPQRNGLRDACRIEPVSWPGAPT